MPSESETQKRDKFIKSIQEEKPFRYIVQNLENTFGEPQPAPKSDALAMLIKIILSQATNDANSRRTFQNLKQRFKTWDDALTADETKIADAIRLGGLANQKARVIKDLLRQLKETRGMLSLKFLEKMTDDDARDFLQTFRGIGPKTIACTLLLPVIKKFSRSIRISFAY